jgi:hypothetical protein
MSRVCARLQIFVEDTTEIVMKLVHMHEAEHSDILANYYAFFASNFELQLYEHSNNIWQLHMEVPIWSFLGKFHRLFEYFTSLDLLVLYA